MKRFYVFICFVFILFLSPFLVNAKSYDSENIDVSFGEETNLNIYYQGYNKFSVEEDNTFYYNGLQYTLSSQDKENGEVTIEGEKLTYSDDTLTSTYSHEFYLFPLKLAITGNKTYSYAQELCYKYGSIERCSIDKGDVTKITSGTYENSFFYSFLPFYSEDIVFDYVYYNLTFTNVSDSSDIIKIERLGFFISEGDTINYKDNFEFEMYDYGYNITNNGKNYIFPRCIRYSYNSYYGQDVVSNIVNCGNELYLTARVYSYSSNLVNIRDYNITISMYVGEGYNTPYTFNSDDILSVKTGYEYTIFGEQTYNYMETFTGRVNNNEGALLYIPISNIITYNQSENTINHLNFKLSISYVLNGNSSDPRAIASLKTTEREYEFDLDEPTVIPTPVEGSKLPDYSTLINNGEVKVKVNIFDHNGIGDISYFISINQSESDYSNKIFTSVSNGDVITVSGEDNYYYIHYRIYEVSTGNYVYRTQQVIIDTTAPVLSSNNFSTYVSNVPYGNVTLNISYYDEALELSNTIYVSKAYFKIIKESEREGLTIEDIANNSVYAGQVVLSKTNIQEDGNYLVCFVLKDYIGNYSDLICSGVYYMDVTSLSKDEVSATSESGYVKEVKTTITITGLDDGVSFRCGLSKTDVTSQSELTNNCYNNKEVTLTVSDEAMYNLWIYASDYAGNYSLIKLDNVFYIDSLAPRISISVTGDRNSYSNDVKVNITHSDLSSIDTENLSYEFYLATYDKNKFTSFTLEEGISYPFDYYGSYKLAIKVCDVMGNCNINTSSDTYLIDTARITLELIGGDKITLLQYQKYVEEGASATKGNAGKNVSTVEYTITGSVDVKTPGVYKIVYSAGEGINKVSIEREVIVVNSNIYIISVISALVLGEVIILARLFIKRKKNDNI